MSDSMTSHPNIDKPLGGDYGRCSGFVLSPSPPLSHFGSHSPIAITSASIPGQVGPVSPPRLSEHTPYSARLGLHNVFLCEIGNDALLNKAGRESANIYTTVNAAVFGPARRVRGFPCPPTTYASIYEGATHIVTGRENFGGKNIDGAVAVLTVT